MAKERLTRRCSPSVRTSSGLGSAGPAAAQPKHEARRVGLLVGGRLSMPSESVAVQRPGEEQQRQGAWAQAQGHGIGEAS